MCLSRTVYVASLVMLTASCTPVLPGEPVGTFKLTMALEENTCGVNAVLTDDGGSFSAELRVEDQVAYWRVPEQPMLNGTYDAPDFAFSMRSIVATSDPDAGAVCRIEQLAELKGTVHTSIEDAGISSDAGGDAGRAPTKETVSASYVLTLTQAAGSDCTDALLPTGPYEKLPCTVRYTLTGVERDSF